MAFTEYQIEYVLYPAYMRLDRDRDMFVAYVKLLFPTANEADIEVVTDIFTKRNPPVVPYGQRVMEKVQDIALAGVGLYIGMMVFFWLTG